MRFAIIILLYFCSYHISAVELETDLNGFRLQQFVTIPEKVYGPPFQTIDADPSEARAYQVDDDAYMVVGHHKEYPHNISMLQLTGVSDKALPFKGLMLGDRKKKVLKTLGEPSSTKELESPKVTVMYYDDRNYSLEIDEKGRLYSIMVFANADLRSGKSLKDGGWEEFKEAVLSKDFERVSETLCPDVEIYKDGKILSIQERYSDFLKKPDKEFVDAFLGKTDSVLQEISRSQPEQEMRITEKMGVGMVFKFRQGEILEEIAFFPYNGKYRVWEVAFRNKTAPDTKSQTDGE